MTKTTGTKRCGPVAQQIRRIPGGVLSKKLFVSTFSWHNCFGEFPVCQTEPDLGRQRPKKTKKLDPQLAKPTLRDLTAE